MIDGVVKIAIVLFHKLNPGTQRLSSLAEVGVKKPASELVFRIWMGSKRAQSAFH